MPSQTTAYIGLGGNIDDRQNYIKTALGALAEVDGIAVGSSSSIIETEPLGSSSQPKYLNAVAEIKTELEPHKLLAALQQIENSLGRQRKQKWGPRTIDLDIVFYGDRIIETEDLAVPHPQSHLRTFVLAGMVELNPGFIHPVLKLSVKELATRLNGRNFALNPEVPQLISIAGLIGVGKTTLAEKVAEKLNADFIGEPYDTNPFLPLVYAGRKELALHCQLYFLFGRLEQLSPAKLNPRQLLFTDYVFQKELIYARQFLTGEQLDIYEKLYPPCAEDITKPVLVVYLKDEPEKCLSRIHQRNRPYEQRIEREFLSRLDTAYEQLFAEWTHCPVIRLSVSEFDCTDDENLEFLQSQMNAYIITDK